jgi:ribonuclease D
VALVQLGWPGRTVLVDPLAVSLEPLSKVLQGTGLAVLHASNQDLEVLDLACGTGPSRLFDTQIAAGFLGYASASLASLSERALRIRLPKGDRLTDWLVRPLTDEQLAYAAADVDHLLAIHDWLLERLVPLGRVEWAEDECEDLRLRGRPERLPHDAWRRIKEARQLRGQPFDIARALAAWREERAVKLDQPVRFVLPDLALVALAQRAPRSAQELRAARGVDDRHVGGQLANEILAVIEAARQNPPPLPELAPQPELARDLRPVVPLITAWINQLAGELDLDPALLGTRADVEAALRGDEGGRLSTGWRADLLGEPIRRLVGGHAALAYDSGRGLVLDERNRT